MEIKPGARVNHYLLTRRLGSGGQGSVWEAFAAEGGSAPRALKLINLNGLDADTIVRAWREARALHDVTHPGLVPCREFFRYTDKGLLGLVFDLVHGQTLSTAARDPRMTAELKAAVIEQLAAILAHVHALGIVHRDLKPDNVLVTDAFWTAPHTPGGIKLVDFGISVRAGNPSPVTDVGSIIGTTPYLPPDLVCPGQWPLDRSGFARDVFAFGVMGWELLFDAHPTRLHKDARIAAYADAYRQRPWPPPSAHGPWMVALRACLALDPRCRPANGAAILEIRQTGRFQPPVPTQAHSGPTDEHLPPTALQAPVSSAATPPRMTEPMRNPPVMSPPVHPTVPLQWHGASAQHRPAPRSQQSARNALAQVHWLGFLLAAGLGAFAVWLVAFPKDTTPLETATRPSEPAATLPSPPQNVFKPEIPDAIPCCHGREPCTSGRSCNTEPCNNVALPTRTWTLRVAGAIDVVKNEDLSGTHPRASVCLRNDRSGENVCAPMKNIASAGGDRINTLHATTNDLAYGRIIVSIIEGSKIIHPATRIADNREGITTSVLCRGLRLRLGPRDSAPIHTLVYLD